MKVEEAQEITELLEGHWPTWKFSKKEVDFWMNTLRPFSYKISKAAINNFYLSYEKQGRPPAAKIMNLLKATQQKDKQRESNEPVLLFEIVKEGRERGYRFFSDGGEMNDLEYLEGRSEYLRRQFNGLYGGNHYVIRHWMAEDLPF